MKLTCLTRKTKEVSSAFFCEQLFARILVNSCSISDHKQTLQEFTGYICAEFFTQKIMNGKSFRSTKYCTTV